MNLVLAIDSSGSMARLDRLEMIDNALRIIGKNLQANDTISVVGFNRQARLLLANESGQAAESLERIADQINPHGGTDLEAGLRLAYEMAQRTFRGDSVNRVILFTDGAANLGNTLADELTKLVEENRRRGIALDCFGIGFDGHNDALLERLSRNGDGRYRFLRSVEELNAVFGEDLLGALRPSAYDVKTQVEFNPDRVDTYQLLGYQQHLLRNEDFRDNSVDAAEMSAAEAGNALYLVAVNDAGKGDLGVVRVRFRDASSGQYEERSWNLPYRKHVPDLRQASPSLRLAAVAASFAALLNDSPLAEEIEYSALLGLSQDLPEFFPMNPQVAQLPGLLLTAQQLSGRP